MLPWQVPPADGGTDGHPLGANLWFQFTTISNQLGTPRTLVCPANPLTTKAAKTWGNEPGGGFLSPVYRNNAVSYFIALHAEPASGTSLLSGDPNIRGSGLSTCSYVPVGGVAIVFSSQDVQWTNAIHGTSGHLLFGDGSVQFTSSAELRSVVSRNMYNNRPVHCIK